ncbi:ARM repeat-containing protein [Macrolepiota fuliginosa MF-IS2]|uniref:ARM repeat-containing protein n=1 Tax=Macrolepiota fuliginosa MF-IS2 TaxID=1400762 RepID=A0A9P6C1Q7_9AGAR|nr:ARM repeat-containing protein [Macrolepiota fuliginosa MF-IS2]
MDVPFISSGALSRAHYALVRKVEESTSEGVVNRVLEAEVRSIRTQLTQPSLPLKQSKEALIVLLYCSMTVSSVFPQGTFDFALPHALNLAEAGTTMEDKRIGYLFCAQMMCPDHEMQLMLVNTLRKDLESASFPRMCLALDNIISASSADVIPAVQRRLHDLLSHNHPSIRRRTLYALRSLSRHEPELLSQVHSNILRRLRDPVGRVVGAAMKVAETSFRLAPAIREAVNDIFEDKGQTYPTTERGTIFASLGVIHVVGLRILSLPAAFDLLTFCISGRDKAIILGLYRLFKDFDAVTLRAVEQQTQISLVGTIRDFLTSRMPNDIFLFLSCLESVDPDLWAGTSDAIPTVLEAWEVNHIMQLLDSNDNLIRKKTLHILGQVDQTILNAYYTQAISITTRIALPLRELNERTKRLLEVLAVISGDNGEVYAIQTKDLLSRIEAHIAGNGILDSAIEGVLLHIRLKDPSFQISCVATMLTILCDTDAELGSTMVIVLVALATEYSRLVSLSPTNLLSGICHRLKGNLPTVQEPCLLAMLRIAADCDKIPAEVTKAVSEASQIAGRHIRRRCDLFLTLSGQKEVLLDIIGHSKSFALPDFLEALEIRSGNVKGKADQHAPEAKFPQTSPGPPRNATSGMPASKLRYDPYDTPHAIPSLRTRRASSSQESVTGSRSDPGSFGGRSPKLLGTKLLSRTITPGDLALVASSGGVESSTGQARPKLPGGSNVDDLVGSAFTSRVDLIALDSPFVEEPLREDEDADTQQELDFENIWNAIEDQQYGVRGWSEASMDSAIGQLQGIDGHRLRVISIDMSPFIGMCWG